MKIDRSKANIRNKCSKQFNEFAIHNYRKIYMSLIKMVGGNA